MDSYGGSVKDGLAQIAPADHVSRTDQSLSSPLERISVLLSRWTALKMAVHNEWGGPDSFKKYEQLVSDIASWFSQPRAGYLNAEDLENLLHERLLLSFNTEIEDGSIEELKEIDECMAMLPKAQ